MHCQNRRWQVDAEAAFAFEAVALHGAVGATYQESPVTARNPQRQRLQLKNKA